MICLACSGLSSLPKSAGAPIRHCNLIYGIMLLDDPRQFHLIVCANRDATLITPILPLHPAQCLMPRVPATSISPMQTMSVTSLLQHISEQAFYRRQGIEMLARRSSLGLRTSPESDPRGEVGKTLLLDLFRILRARYCCGAR